MKRKREGEKNEEKEKERRKERMLEIRMVRAKERKGGTIRRYTLFSAACPMVTRTLRVHKMEFEGF